MPRFDAITGPFNTTFSPNVQSELTMNWMAEGNGVSVEGQGTEVHDKNVRCSLVRLPGLKTFVTLPNAPVRGVFPGEFRLFAVGGAHFYEIKSGGTIIDRSTAGFSGASGIGTAGGTIGNDGRPVQFFSNGNQIMLVSNKQVYIDNGNGPVPAQFSDPLTDLVIDPADTSGKTLTTATGNFFDASDVGRTVQITGGAGFTVGLTQHIISVVGGEAIGAVSWGTPGSSLGTGIEWIGNISLSDLSVTPGTVNGIHSASYKFGPSDIGTTLTITGGAGFTAGAYNVIGLITDGSGNPTGDAILFVPPGALGAGPGSGTLQTMFVSGFQGAFLDGYFFAAPYPLTKDVFFSGAPDGTIDGFMWDPTNFFSKSDYPDNVIALFADHEELYVCGDLESTEVFRDIGASPPNSPFAPDPGGFMHYGCQAAFSFTRLSNGVAWIAQDTRRGSRRAVLAVGYNPQVISTPAVQNAWRQYSRIDDAEAYTISYMGHELWVISFPTANAVWYYDVTTGFWGQWGNYNGTGWDRHKVWVHCVVALDGQIDVHYGGDWSTGQIYTMSETYKTDDGNPIMRRRRSPHNTVENKRRFYARFEIDCDVLGLQRIFWNRLGAGRDRIWQIDSIQSSETGGVTLTLGFSDDRLQTVQTMFTQTLDPSVDVSIANAYLQWADASWN